MKVRVLRSFVGRFEGVKFMLAEGEQVEMGASAARYWADVGFVEIQGDETQHDRAKLDSASLPQDAADLPERIVEALAEAGLQPEDTAGYTDQEILSIDGIGPASLKDIRKAVPYEG